MTKAMRAQHPVPRWLITTSATLFLAGFFIPPGFSQSVEGLLQKLVEKGVLTQQEAADLKKEATASPSSATSPAQKNERPDWVSRLRFSGDFRGRFEGFYSENDAFTERDRWRYRARFGVTANLFDGFEVGLRLGSGDIDSYPSGGIDPISNNQTFQNNASKKGIFIDLAYMQWTPWDEENRRLVLTAGKMENPFVFSDMVFDSDYTPEGLGAQAELRISDRNKLLLNGGAFVVDELGSSPNDPYMFGGQLRLDTAWTKKFSTTAGLALIGLTDPESLENSRIPNINVGNTHNSNRALAYDYYPFIADAYATWKLEKFPLYPGAFPIRLGGEYMHNEGAPRNADNYAWLTSVTFGKAGKRNTWEVSYTYKWLGANAWWEEVVDSDFGAYWKAPPPFAANDASSSDKNSAGYFAGTNVKGHIVKIAYSPYDFLTLSAKWFYTDLISSDFLANDVEGSTETHRLQVDALLKF